MSRKVLNVQASILDLVKTLEQDRHLDGECLIPALNCKFAGKLISQETIAEIRNMQLLSTDATRAYVKTHEISLNSGYRLIDGPTSSFDLEELRGLLTTVGKISAKEVEKYIDADTIAKLTADNLMFSGQDGDTLLVNENMNTTAMVSTLKTAGKEEADLYPIFKLFEKSNATNQLPCIATTASLEGPTLKLSAVADPDVIVYEAPEFGLVGDKAIVINKDTPMSEYLDKDGNIKMNYMPAYLLGVVGGCWGNKVTWDIPAFGRIGGNESSGIFLALLLRTMARISGCPLNSADYAGIATWLENLNGGYTGGQGPFAIEGGYRLTYMLSKVKNADGTPKYNEGIFSVKMVADEELGNLTENMQFIVPGKDYKNGNAVENRYAAVTNFMWCKSTFSPEGRAILLHKFDEKDRYAIEGLPHLGEEQGNAAVVTSLNNYADIRNATTKFYLTQVVRYMQKGTNIAAWENMAGDQRQFARWAYEGIFSEVLSQDNPFLPEINGSKPNNFYGKFEDVRKFFEQNKGLEEKVAEMRIYELGNEDFIDAMKAIDAGAMCAGAGGPGTGIIGAAQAGNLIKVEAILDAFNIPEMTAELKAKFTRILRGEENGTISFWERIQARKEGVIEKGTEELPDVQGQPIKARMDKWTGKIYNVETGDEITFASVKKKG